MPSRLMKAVLPAPQKLSARRIRNYITCWRRDTKTCSSIGLEFGSAPTEINKIALHRFSVIRKELMRAKPFARRNFTTSLPALSTFANYIDDLRRTIWIVDG